MSGVSPGECKHLLLKSLLAVDDGAEEFVAAEEHDLASIKF